MQELPSPPDYKSRMTFAEELKRLIATESHALHPKYCDAVTIYPWWRVSLSINNNVDRLKALPSLTSDFSDKVLLLLCVSRPMPMPTNTNEERRAFRKVIQQELPAFVAFLLQFQVPAELLQTKHASRFGHDHYHHPDITAALFEQEPQNSLLYMLDNCVSLYIGGSWGWGRAQELQEHLCEEARFGAQARKLFSFSNACGVFLSKLAEKFPDRIEHKHTVTGNVWLIHPPAA